MDLAAVAGDKRTRDAVERCLSRIAEAAAKLGSLAEDLEPDQPWNNIRGYGNRLRHGYDGVRPPEVMGIITQYLPDLKIARVRALDARSDDA